MLLHTKITLFAIFIVVTIVVILVITAVLHENALQKAHQDFFLQKIQSVWQGIIDHDFKKLRQMVHTMAKEPQFILNIHQKNHQALQNSPTIQSILDAHHFTALEVYTQNSERFFSTHDQFLLGTHFIIPTRERFGLRIINETLQGVTIIPVGRSPTPEGAVVMVFDMKEQITLLRKDFNTDYIYVLDRDQELVYANAPNLWQQIREVYKTPNTQVLPLYSQGHHYSLYTFPFYDFDESLSGSLILISDTTRTVRQDHITKIILILGIVLGSGGVLYGYWYYVKHAFGPLDDVITAIQKLKERNTHFYLETVQTDSQMRRLQKAVETLQRQTFQFLMLDRASERQYKRQMRFIHQQMHQLSSVLEGSDRSAVLQELHRIEQQEKLQETQKLQEKQSVSTPSQSDIYKNVHLIGTTLEYMCNLIKKQKNDLTKTIQQLNYALVEQDRLSRLDQELLVAKDIQEAILPDVFPTLEHWSLAAQMTPAREVGGDFYDFFEIDDERFGVVIADVSGKGIPAAFFMLIAQTLLRPIAFEGEGPAATLAQLSNLLYERNKQELFISVFYAEVYKKDGRITYTNGGHNYPLILTSHQDVFPLSPTGDMALASLPNQSFSESTCVLGSGDQLVMFTDGVVEAHDGSMSLFGQERLTELLKNVVQSDVQETVSRILDAVTAFSQDVTQSDDITCIVLKHT